MLKRLGLVLAGVLFAAPALAEDLTAVQFVACYDGDTCTFNLTTPGLPQIFSRELPVRLVGIDTPEIRGQCREEREMALAAKDILNAKLRRARHITLKDVKPDKYFRIDATIEADGLNINHYLTETGLARPYNGGKRLGWCPTKGADHE